MNAPQVNIVAIWKPMHKDGLLIKVYENDYRYKDKGRIKKANKKTPIVRYVKNYFNKYTQKFSLCLITTELDCDKLEAWLDEIATEVNPERDVDFLVTGYTYEQKGG